MAASRPGSPRSAEPLVVAVGRLVPVKRFDLLIDELVGLAAKVSDEKPARLPFRPHVVAPFSGVL